MELNSHHNSATSRSTRQEAGAKKQTREQSLSENAHVLFTVAGTMLRGKRAVRKAERVQYLQGRDGLN